jgi:outer membrane lipoprotein SlyB
MKTMQALPMTIIFASALLCGCEHPPTSSAPGSTFPTSSAVSGYGVIDSIQVVQTSSGSSGTVGTVAGGVIGGLIGNQIGSGSGRTAATIAGAAGGAVAGNQIERNRQSGTRQTYQIGVRMDNGGYQTIQQDNIADLNIGTKVRIQNGQVFRY